MFGRERNTNATRRLKYDIENNTQYNRLKIIKYDHYKKIGYAFKDYVVCDCSCGNKNIVKEYQGILSGTIKSCGCLNNETRIIVGKNNKRYNTYDLTGEYGIGYTSKGEEFWFDLEDYDKIKFYSWHKDKKGYFSTSHNKHSLHRLVMNCENEKNIQIDHVNRKPFDNRKENLNIVTSRENAQNKGIYKNNTSSYSGVGLRPNGKWQARIQIDGRRISLGCYDNIEDAIQAKKEGELD